jgi:hypothetical protein
LTVGTIVSFAEVVLAPRNSDPGPWASAILGVLLLRRAIIKTPQPAVAIISGAFLTALLVVGNHGFVNINRPAWIVSTVVVGLGFAFGEKIEEFWM